MSTEANCGNCRFWTPDRRMPGTKFTGRCRAVAPGYSGSFPKTEAADWCGEFEPREPGPESGERLLECAGGGSTIQ